MTEERKGHVEKAKYHWKQFRTTPLWSQVTVILFLVTILVLFTGTGALVISQLADAASADPPVDFDQACKEQLGPEWQMVGWAEFPPVDHYHVQCTENPDSLNPTKNARWITVDRVATPN